MKKYTINFMFIEDSSDFVSKGHHDPAQFCEAIKKEHGIKIDPGLVFYETWRAIPDSTGAYDFKYHWATPGSRGSFPVTVA